MKVSQLSQRSKKGGVLARLRPTTVVLALLVVTGATMAASADTPGTTLTVTPNASLNPTGQTVQASGTGFGDGTGAIYQCIPLNDGLGSEVCSEALAAFTASGGTFGPVNVTVSATFTADGLQTTCSVAAPCSLWAARDAAPQNDHAPIAFGSGGGGTTTTVTIPPRSNVSVSQTDSPDPVVAGENITYSITVTATTAGGTAQNVTLSNAIPASATFVSRTAPGGWTCNPQAVGSTDGLQCSRASVTGSHAFTLVVRVQLQSPSGTVVTNQATVSATGDDTATGNNVATTTTAVTFRPSRPAVIRSSTTWLLRNTLDSGSADNSFPYGTKPLVPIGGDWNGDGTRTPGTFEAGVFKLNNGYDSAVDFSFTFGDPRGFPVAGDFNGDGTDDVAVVRAGAWQVRLSTGVVLPTFTFGPALTWPTAVPVAGDWNGDGIDGIGIYNGGVWSLKNTAASGAADLTPTFGPGTNPYPVVGDWNGDGIDTVGVKAVTGTLWQVSNSNLAPAAATTFNFGQANTDIPLAWR